MNKRTAKARAWKQFSKYIRLRDSDKDGYCECISCGVRRFWEGEGMQAGHLIGGRSNAVLFHEDLVYSQCASCNYRSGEQASFWLALKKVKNWNDEKWAELKALKNKTIKYTFADLKEIEEKYADMAIGEAHKRGLVI